MVWILTGVIAHTDGELSIIFCPLADSSELTTGKLMKILLHV